MWSQFRPAASLILLFTLVLGVAFPVALSGLVGAALPYQANGSLLLRDGKPIGSALIGQDFTGPEWFHARPSALTGTDPKDPAQTIPTPYDARESGASNLAPTSAALVAQVKARAARLGGGTLPADAVTASGSGLDPDISPAFAAVQAGRVARARGLPVARVRALLAAHTEGRWLGFVGEPRVNVLRLNLALAGATRAGR
jgi:K+-transporting ATPase ATPase C chain